MNEIVVVDLSIVIVPRVRDTAQGDLVNVTRVDEAETVERTTGSVTRVYTNLTVEIPLIHLLCPIGR
jgi:hypothetical protein